VVTAGAGAAAPCACSGDPLGGARRVERRVEFRRLRAIRRRAESLVRGSGDDDEAPRLGQALVRSSGRGVEQALDRVARHGVLADPPDTTALDDGGEEIYLWDCLVLARSVCPNG